MSFFGLFNCCSKPENQKPIEANVFALSEKGKNDLQNEDNISSNIKGSNKNNIDKICEDGKRTKSKNNSNEHMYSFISDNESNKEERESKNSFIQMNEIPLFENKTKNDADNNPSLFSGEGPPSYSKNKRNSDLPKRISYRKSSSNDDNFSNKDKNKTKETDKDKPKDNDYSISGNSPKHLNYEFNFNTVINEEEIELAPKLIVQEKNNSGIFNGKIYHIDAGGESNKEKKNGIVLFGPLIEDDKELEGEDNLQNDIIVYFNKIKSNLKHYFAIYYNSEKASYYLQNMNNDFKRNKYFIYTKISHELILDKEYINEDKQKNSVLFILGEIFISINFEKRNIIQDALDETFKNKNEIQIRVYINKNKNDFQEYKFNEDSERITVGREGCIINIDNRFVSRIHCTIYFKKEIGYWIIEDGDCNGKHSTHGTWLLVSDKYMFNTIEDEFEFKIGNQYFTVNVDE